MPLQRGRDESAQPTGSVLFEATAHPAINLAVSSAPPRLYMRGGAGSVRCLSLSQDDKPLWPKNHFGHAQLHEIDAGGQPGPGSAIAAESDAG